MAERLTYLLGICVAVISWSVTQLSTSFGDEEIIGYRVETSSVDEHWDATTLHLENLSRTKATETIVVSPKINSIESVQSAKCEPDLRYYPTILAVKDTADPGKNNGSSNIGVGSLAPGASLDVYLRYPHGCAVVPAIELGSTDISQGTSEKPQGRLLRFGMETWVISHRFGIIITLIAVFGIIFGIAFATAINIARRGTT